MSDEYPSLGEEMERTQVVVFAGGMGKRMGTDHPKALIQVGGRTLLDRCIDLYSGAGFTKFVFVLGHMHEEILLHLEERDTSGITYTCSVDPETGMGRAKSFKHSLMSGAVSASERAMIVYPDDLFTDDELPGRILTEHLRATESLGTVGSMVLAKGLKWPYGVATVEGSGLVTQFVEKPLVYYPSSVGSYVLEPEVYHMVSRCTYDVPIELEETLIPDLSTARKLYALFIPSECWLPVNTPKDLEEAQRALAKMHLQKLASHAASGRRHRGRGPEESSLSQATNIRDALTDTVVA